MANRLANSPYIACNGTFSVGQTIHDIVQVYRGFDVAVATLMAGTSCRYHHVTPLHSTTLRFSVPTSLTSLTPSRVPIRSQRTLSRAQFIFTSLDRSLLIDRRLQATRAGTLLLSACRSAKQTLTSPLISQTQPPFTINWSAQTRWTTCELSHTKFPRSKHHFPTQSLVRNHSASPPVHANTPRHLRHPGTLRLSIIAILPLLTT